MRRSAKNVSQGKRNALPSGELTCSESQVDDMFSAGESTEDERIYPAKETEQKPIASSRGRLANEKSLRLRLLTDTTVIE